MKGKKRCLLNLLKKKRTDVLTLRHYDPHCKTNEQTVQEMLNLTTSNITRQFKKKTSLLPEKFVIANVGRQDAKKHLEEHFSNLMSSNEPTEPDSCCSCPTASGAP